MSEYAYSGETTKRDLHKDDINGICNLYPLERDPEICEEPICGLNTTCVPNDNGCVAFQNEREEAINCSTVPGGTRSHGLFSFIPILF
jgi:hypothetical protein